MKKLRFKTYSENLHTKQFVLFTYKNVINKEVFLKVLRKSYKILIKNHKKEQTYKIISMEIENYAYLLFSSDEKYFSLGITLLESSLIEL